MLTERDKKLLSDLERHALHSDLSNQAIELIKRLENRLSRAEDYIAEAFHPEIGWAVPRENAEKLTHEVHELKQLWFDDANPLETNYQQEFRNWCLKRGMDPKLRSEEFYRFDDDLNYEDR